MPRGRGRGGQRIVSAVLSVYSVLTQCLVINEEKGTPNKDITDRYDPKINILEGRRRPDADKGCCLFACIAPNRTKSHIQLVNVVGGGGNRGGN